MDDNANSNGASGNYPRQGSGVVSNRLNNFETQFRNMVVAPELETQPERSLAGNPERKKKSNENIIFAIALILAGLGIVGVVASAVNYNRALAEQKYSEQEYYGLLGLGQGEGYAYKDLPFSADYDSNAPLLVYTSVRNGQQAQPGWLEEFRGASEKYSKEYNSRKAIPNQATFENVEILSDLTGDLFPYPEIIRFLIETSSGCARFDFYPNLLLLYDYEFSSTVCDETEWNYLDKAN